MQWIRLLILLSVVTQWVCPSEAQTSGGGPTQHSSSVAFCDVGSGNCAYPYKVNVTTGSIYNPGTGVINITTSGSGGGGSSYPWASTAGINWPGVTNVGNADFGGYNWTNISQLTVNTKVGIGTTSPVNPLGIAYSDNNYVNGLKVQNTNSGNQAVAGLQVMNQGGDNAGFAIANSNYVSGNGQYGQFYANYGLIFNANNQGLNNVNTYFKNNNVTQMTILNGGNVGIGTTSPTDFLNVATTSANGVTINSTAVANGIDSFTKLALHLDNNVTDYEITPKTVTNNSMLFSNSIYKFGNYSGTFDGATSYLTTPSSADWQFGTGDVTIAFWFYPTVNTAAFTYLIGTEAWPAGGAGWAILLFSNHLQADFENNGLTSGQVGTVNMNAWNHVALTRSGTSANLFLNGTSVYSVTNSSNVAGTNALNIGRSPSGGEFFTGQIDEVLIDKGKALWTSNFTPPTVAYSGAIGFPQYTTSVSGTTTGFMKTNGNDANNLEFGTTGASQLSLTTAGKFGIGTVTPTQLLEVGGTSQIDTGLIVPLIYPASDSTTAIQIDKANGSTNVLDVDTTNARVGIGTTAPATTLDVEGGNFTLGSAGTNQSLINNGITTIPTAGSSIFGSGVDGNVTVSSGVTTLTKDMNYLNLTVSGTGTIRTSGYKIFVLNKLDISAAPVGAISSNSGTTGNGSGATGGTSAGNGNTAATLPAGVFASIGANGTTTTGGNASSNTTLNYCLGGAGGIGGAGGASTSAGGSAGATATCSNVNLLVSNPIFNPFQFSNASNSVLVYQSANGGTGGGGGGGDAVNAGGGAGAGLNAPGIVHIAARYINRSGSTAAGAIQAKGGGFTNGTSTGGNGAAGVAGNAGGGGGGGGNGGGFVWIVTEGLLGSTATNAIDVSGGAGGNGGNGLGTGNGGKGGSGGNCGNYQILNLGTNTNTFGTGNGAGTAGGNNTGATGGTGGAGCTQTANL